MNWLMFKFQNNNNMSMLMMNLLYDYLLLIIIIIMINILFLMIKLINYLLNKSMMENLLLENLWTLYPIIITLLMMIMSIKIMYMNFEYKINILNIKIIGNQWYWYYEYQNFNKYFDSYMMYNNNFNFNNLETNNHLILPIYFNMQLIITSMDVIHAWTIPSLNVKLDAIPNNLNQINLMINNSTLMFGQCSEICGMNHSLMPIQIESIPMNKFLNWLM